MQGSQGDYGPQGSQGDYGPQGSQGDYGPQGSQGDYGPQGSQGDYGPQGSQGWQGEYGPQGEGGCCGVQGYQGSVGKRGYGGPPGPQGAMGKSCCAIYLPYCFKQCDVQFCDKFLFVCNPENFLIPRDGFFSNLIVNLTVSTKNKHRDVKTFEIWVCVAIAKLSKHCNKLDFEMTPMCCKFNYEASNECSEKDSTHCYRQTRYVRCKLPVKVAHMARLYIQNHHSTNMCAQLNVDATLEFSTTCHAC